MNLIAMQINENTITVDNIIILDIIIATAIIILGGLAISWIRRGFLGFIIKTVLIVIICIFGLCNYRILSLDKGLSKFSTDNENGATYIIKAEYYKKTITNDEDEYEYYIFISTNEDNYLLNVTEDYIESLSIKPNKISPIPFWAEIAVIFVILIIPIGRKQKRTKTTT